MCEKKTVLLVFVLAKKQGECNLCVSDSVKAQLKKIPIGSCVGPAEEGYVFELEWSAT